MTKTAIATALVIALALPAIVPAQAGGSWAWTCPNTVHTKGRALSPVTVELLRLSDGPVLTVTGRFFFDKPTTSVNLKFSYGKNGLLNGAILNGKRCKFEGEAKEEE